MEEAKCLAAHDVVKQDGTARETDLLKVSLKLEADVVVEGRSGSMADRVKRRRRGQLM